uniref:Uncharacterized protein n=1 Tax=Rhizophora mucronata TaxID=61149 RepID=A0A2P2NQA9_RHIMU
MVLQSFHLHVILNLQSELLFVYKSPSIKKKNIKEARLKIFFPLIERICTSEISQGWCLTI